MTPQDIMEARIQELRREKPRTEEGCDALNSIFWILGIMKRRPDLRYISVTSANID